METETLLQEAHESIEAARTYRRELQQRLKGLHLARQQVTMPGRDAAGARLESFVLRRWVCGGRADVRGNLRNVRSSLRSIGLL